ncbi:MAG: hypothetical protein CL600_07145 [Alteromonas sp.]|jgi:putative membrane protein|uniref:PH domain-containing protein n=1 Tax=unclassified Alteromonas TaxID=2614992 RepID=UPI00090457B7|nr:MULTISPECIES: PH domain-containing protein [unclassified Alteromonas]APE04662.1 hypothetical protein BM528_01805 [Alteromonas sp. RW2A1]AUC87042.1 hypothetical protein CW735_01585 [Alteromonas sp. MB-3u-76]MAI64632.1 hypothetical protein [Alteromonas sp.]
MAERIILEATFNPAVKRYWLVSLLLFSTLIVIGIPFLIISIPLFLVISNRTLAAMSATITERKLVVKRGIFHKEEKSIPLEKITDVAMVQGPLMRVFNLYRLSFETAGQSAQGALVSLLGIDDAANFRETILSQKDAISVTGTSTSGQSEDKQSEMSVLIDSVKRIEGLLEALLKEK